MKNFLDPTWTTAILLIAYKDRDINKIRERINKAKAFIQNNPSDTVNFRMAGGLLGVLSATQPEAFHSYWYSLIVAYVLIFLVCSITFGSFKVGVILIIPMALSQSISWALMLFKNIYISVNILPVAAIGIGVSATYGIYLIGRIFEEYQNMCLSDDDMKDQCLSPEHAGDRRKTNRTVKDERRKAWILWAKKYNSAIERAVNRKGKLIIFMGIIHFSVMILWAFIGLKFAAHMGLILSFLMLFNLTAALILIPSLMSLWKPKFFIVKDNLK